MQVEESIRQAIREEIERSQGSVQYSIDQVRDAVLTLGMARVYEAISTLQSQLLDNQSRNGCMQAAMGDPAFPEWLATFGQGNEVWRRKVNGFSNEITWEQGKVSYCGVHTPQSGWGGSSRGYRFGARVDFTPSGQTYESKNDVFFGDPPSADSSVASWISPAARFAIVEEAHRLAEEERLAQEAAMNFDAAVEEVAD